MNNTDVCKTCRKEGVKLFLKGERCLGTKCAVARRVDPTKPRAFRRGLTSSEFGKQLKEKQKIKSIYGISEKQLSIMFKNALHAQGSTAEIFMQNIERRLDNIVYRLGFAASRPQARQMVSHGHIKVNSKKVDIASYKISQNDIVTLDPKFELFDAEAVDWLKTDKKKKEGKVLSIPTREQIPSEVEEQLIIEYYSR